VELSLRYHEGSLAAARAAAEGDSGG
jgi:hypothetical protein